MHGVFRMSIRVFALACLFCAVPAKAYNADELKEELVKEGIDPEYINTVLSDPRIVKERVPKNQRCRLIIGDIVQNKKESPFALRNRTSIEMGVRYYKDNKALFDAAKRSYGVESEYLLGLLRIETYFGNCLGK